MQVGRADLHEFHGQFLREKSREGHFQLRIGKKENALARELIAIAHQRPLRALIGGLSDAAKSSLIHRPHIGRGLQPSPGAFGAQGKYRIDAPGSPFLQRARGVR